MDKSCVITLVSEVYSRDEYGIIQPTETQKQVYAQVDSVSRSEFFEGGRNGLNPELVFRLFFGDYAEEKEILYEGRKYGIYRTYRGRGDIIELYAERKGGLNHESQG